MGAPVGNIADTYKRSFLPRFRGLHVLVIIAVGR
jgi:hypothetical protein